MDNNSTAATPVNIMGSDPGSPVAVTIDGPLPLPVTSTDFSEKHQVLGGAVPVVQVVVSTEPCELRTLTGYNSNADTTLELYVQLHEAGAAIAPGAVPAVVIPVKGRQTFSLSQDLEFAHLVLAISTTEFTFTAAAASMVYQVTYGIVPP
jgi:hypothetical protein